MKSCRAYFSRNLLDGSRGSAQETLPLLLQLMQPKSVIDVGCGVGSWLAVFRELGVDDVVGVDAGWADKKKLEIPRERFLVFDLKKPFSMDRQFDLVLSLEVAQHLPARCARTFVDSLTSLGPVILFSAAIPFQGGIHHVNEQWPEYWARYFQDRDYAVIDCLRKKIWHNDKVEWWFAQNILLFVHQDYCARCPLLNEERERSSSSQLALVHPRRYLAVTESLDRWQRTADDIVALVPPGDTFILVGDGEVEHRFATGRRALPFLERTGQSWGNPPDDSTAVRELERLCRSGVGFIAFAWPAFWWFDQYAAFHRHLRAEFPCVLENNRLVVFDLRRPARPSGADGADVRTHRKTKKTKKGKP